MQGRPAVPVDGVHVRASPDEQLDGLRPTGDRRPEQRRPAALAAEAVHRRPARQVPLDGAEVTRVARPPRCSTPRRSARRPPGFREADDIATPEIQFVAGTMVTIPSSKGRNTRWNRCLTSDPRPRRCSSIALKKPLMTKKSGIRKPWMAEKTIPKPGSCRRSVTIQNDGKNERDGVQDDPQQHGDGPQGVQVGSSGEGRDPRWSGYTWL